MSKCHNNMLELFKNNYTKRIESLNEMMKQDKYNFAAKLEMNGALKVYMLLVDEIEEMIREIKKYV